MRHWHHDIHIIIRNLLYIVCTFLRSLSRHMRHEFCRIWTHTASAAIFIRLRPCRLGIEGFVTVPAQSTLLLFSILTPARKVNTSHSEAFQSEPGQAKARRTFGVIACTTAEIYQIRFNFIFLSGF